MLHFCNLKSTLLDYFRSNADLTEREQYFITIDIYGGYAVYQKSVSDRKDYELDLERVQSDLKDLTGPWLNGVFNPDGDIFVRDTISNYLTGITSPAAKNVWFEEVFLQDLYWNYEPIQRLSLTSHKIVSFYSYKGGTGRTTALLLTAISMARMGKKVVLIDLDIESPHLFQYFPESLLPKYGLLDYLVESKLYDLGKSLSAEDYLHPVTDVFDITTEGAMYIVPACGTELLSHPEDYRRALLHISLDLYLYRQERITPIDVFLTQIDTLVHADYLLIDTCSGIRQNAGITLNRYSGLSLLFSASD